MFSILICFRGGDGGGAGLIDVFSVAISFCLRVGLDGVLMVAVSGVVNSCNVSRVRFLVVSVDNVLVFVMGSGRLCMGGGRCNDTFRGGVSG